MINYSKLNEAKYTIFSFFPLFFLFDSEGQSAAIPVASMEFAAICLRNALLLLPEHQPQDLKAEPGSTTSSQPGSAENSSDNNDICRYLFVFSIKFFKLLKREWCFYLKTWGKFLNKKKPFI